MLNYCLSTCLKGKCWNDDNHANHNHRPNERLSLDLDREHGHYKVSIIMMMMMIMMMFQYYSDRHFFIYYALCHSRYSTWLSAMGDSLPRRCTRYRLPIRRKSSCYNLARSCCSHSYYTVAATIAATIAAIVCSGILLRPFTWQRKG